MIMTSRGDTSLCDRLSIRVAHLLGYLRMRWTKLRLCLCLGLFSLATCLLLGESAKETTPVSNSGNTSGPVAEPSASKSKSQDRKKKKGRGSIVAAPLPISSAAIGTGLIPVLLFIFPFSRSDKASPPSTVGAVGLITNNGSRAFGVGGQLFFDQNKYEVTGAYARGNLNYNIYGLGLLSGGADLKLPLVQTGQVVFGEALRRVWRQFFIGPRFWNGESLVTVRPSDSQLPPIPPEVGLHTTLRALGIRVVRDTRPNHFYPVSGMKLEFTSDFFSQTLGSKYSYQSYKGYFDKFWSLTKNQVIAYDLFICSTAGKPPFYGNCIYGTSNELRGYVGGTYLDRHMFATQVEYRLSLPKRVGFAGFGGIGEAFPGSTQFLRKDEFLPSIGAGPRYQLSTKYHLNLRADVAKGIGSWTWSMGVGEAF